MARAKHKEVDLYEPVRSFLEQQGFEVRAEVKHCDLIATRGEELVVVELKLGLTIELLAQANDRLALTDCVYAAIPRAVNQKRGRKWQRVLRLLRRLEVGLLVVDLDSKEPCVEVVFHPLAYQRPRSKRRKEAVLLEMAGRSGGQNQGGCHRTKLITAYREQAIFLACALEVHGPMTAATARSLGASSKAHSIFYRNVYGWFERIARGLYALTPTGARELQLVPELAESCRERLANLKEPTG